MSELLNFSNPLELMLIDYGVTELLKTNEESASFGLFLSARDAKEIIECRNEVLQSYGRVELSMDVLDQLTLAVSSSPYINREDFVQTIHEFVELFYYAKNETLDLISDDELIELMKMYFDNSCRGSIELLQSREIENLIRAIRGGYSIDQIEDSVPDDYSDEDESEDY